MTLEKTFYIPNFSRNLISISRLVPYGYSFTFSDSFINIFYKFDFVGNGTLSDGLFHVNLQNDACYNTMHTYTSNKKCVMNENSFMLWHRRL